LVSFAILHEITAIVPLPIFFYTLEWTNASALSIVPESYLETGQEFVHRLIRRYPQWFQSMASDETNTQRSTVDHLNRDLSNSTVDDQQTTSDVKSLSTDLQNSLVIARKILHLATSYALVKLMLPLRLAASAAMTPCIARNAVQPIGRWISWRKS
jgi:hypothetical protein